MFEQAAKCYETLGNRREWAKAMGSLSAAQNLGGDRAAAEQSLRRAIALSEETGDETAVASHTASLANILLLQGSAAEADRCYERAIEIYRRLNNDLGLARLWRDRGNLLLGVRKDAGGAEPALRQAVDAFTRVGQRAEVGKVLTALAAICINANRRDEGEQHLRKALELLGTEDARQTALAEFNLGTLRLVRQDLGEAEALLKRSLERFEALKDQGAIAEVTARLALVYVARSQFDSANAALERALALDEQLGRQENIVQHCLVLGQIAAGRSQIDRAEGFYQRALEILRARGNRQGMEVTLRQLAVVATARGDLDKAQQLIKEAAALRGAGPAPEQKGPG
jgi:tetratricopeptide (TPR) repeat protein